MENELVNLTGNDITIMLDGGGTIVLQKSDIRAHVKIERKNQPSINGVPICLNIKKEVYGVPEVQKGKFYIVNKVVQEALSEKGRKEDILCPDSTVRNNNQIVIGCRNLSQFK
jgi:hypothetical protein